MTATSDERAAEVIVLPGVERRDIVGSDVPSVHVLQGAIALGITDVVIVGRHRDGSQYVAGETQDIDRATGILFRAATWLATGEYNGGIFPEKEDT